ncbi:hypothetical protein AX16_007694 [Volvariella volvacea WC 439]|nr:hypothetical protein AX16_007694 [Volvariella volvacea WC 439]
MPMLKNNLRPEFHVPHKQVGNKLKPAVSPNYGPERVHFGLGLMYKTVFEYAHQHTGEIPDLPLTVDLTPDSEPTMIGYVVAVWSLDLDCMFSSYDNYSRVSLDRAQEEDRVIEALKEELNVPRNEQPM